MFKDLFVKLLQENNVTAYKLSKDTGINESLIRQWKSGRQLPKYDSIKILCDYFDISADYLLERTNVKEMNKTVKPMSIVEEFQALNDNISQTVAYGENVTISDKKTNITQEKE